MLLLDHRLLLVLVNEELKIIDVYIVVVCLEFAWTPLEEIYYV